MESDKNLVLPVNTYWGDIIDSGQIDWDYREVKPYWISRICSCPSGTTDIATIVKSIRKFDTVTLFNRHNGHKSVYSVDDIVVIDGSKYDLFQNGKFYFIIKLGRVIYK